MSGYLLYSVQASSIAAARALVEVALSEKLEERESSYHRGPYYKLGRAGGENFELKINLDPFEDVPNEDEFPQAEFILYVNGTDRPSEVMSMLSSEAFSLLRQEEF